MFIHLFHKIFSTMKPTTSKFALISILFALVALQACKSKKVVQKSAPVAETTAPAPVPPPAPTPAPVVKPAPVVSTPAININTVKIQFEFDSSILKTDAYTVLDQVASVMKANPSVNYVLKGYASAEGTPEHNQKLSKDRANSVKTYLVNAGVSSAIITANGYGTSNPVADNSTDAGRVLNRRVEIGN